MTMERIAGDVRGELRRFGPAAGMVEIVTAWPAAVGDGIAANAWPARLAPDGTLHVAADSSAWAFELTQLAPEILARLREALGPDAPAGVRFAPGRLPERGGGATARPSANPPQVGPAEQERARELAKEIGDEELRELVARAAAVSLSRRSSDR